MEYDLPDYADAAAQRARGLLDDATSALQARLDRSAREMEQMVAEMEPVPDEQVAKIRDMYLTGPCAAEWQPVAEKVGRGELTWREVAEGQAFRDPDVAAAMQASFQHAREHPPEPPAPTQVERPTSSRGGDDHDDDPDYFTGGGYLRG